MTTAFDKRLVPVAKKLIEAYGVEATLTEAGSADPSTGGYSPGSAATTTATPPSTSRAYVAQDGGTFASAAQSYVLPGVEPEVGGSLTIGDASWSIVRVRALRTGDEIAAYAVEVTD